MQGEKKRKGKKGNGVCRERTHTSRRERGRRERKSRRIVRREGEKGVLVSNASRVNNNSCFFQLLHGEFVWSNHWPAKKG